MTATLTPSSFARIHLSARASRARVVWGGAALTLLITLLAPSAGEAQRRRRPTPAPEAAEQPGEAARRAAQAAFAAGDFAEAERLYVASLAEREDPVVYIGLADARERQQSPQGAVTALERYLAMRPDAPDRAAVEARVAALRALRGVVLVTAEPPGEVWLDGERTGYVTPVELTLTPGSHGVAVTVRGEIVAEHAVDVPFGGRTTLALVEGALAPADGVGVEGDSPVEPALTTEPADASSDVSAASPDEPTLAGDGIPLDEPAAAAAPRASNYEPRRAAGISASIAAGTLVMGTVLGFMALTEQSDFDVSPTAASANRGERLALFSDVMFGVAGIAAVTSIVLYVTDKRAARRASAAAEAEAARLRLVPLAGRQGAGMRATLTF